MRKRYNRRQTSHSFSVGSTSEGRIDKPFKVYLLLYPVIVIYK